MFFNKPKSAPLEEGLIKYICHSPVPGMLLSLVYGSAEIGFLLIEGTIKAEAFAFDGEGCQSGASNIG